MNMLYVYLIFINIGLISIILNKYIKNEFLLKSLSIIIMTFLIEYTLGAIILLSINRFGVGRIIIGICLINIILTVFYIKMQKNNIVEYMNLNININIKATILSVIIITVLLPFVWQKSEFIFPAQDGGVYALKSIDLLNGDTNNIKELYEYELVEDNEKSKVKDFQNKQIGLYKTNVADGKYSYEYHGIPTWPALMALSGKIWGIENISGILTVLFGMLLIFVYSILDEFNVRTESKIVAMIVVGFSPLTIYLTKHSLSEMFWTVMFMFAVLTIINKHNLMKIIGAVALGLLGFIHLSTVMYLPILAFILFILQIIYKRKIYGIINIIFSVFFIISLGYGYIVSKSYFLNIYRGSIGKNLGIKNEMMTLAIIIIMNMIIIGLAIILIYNEGFNKFVTKIWRAIDVHLLNIVKYILIIILLYSIYQGYKLGFTNQYIEGKGAWTFRTLYANKGIYSLVHLNIFSIMEATSYFILPIVIYGTFRMKKIDNQVKIFLLLFIYTMAIYTIISVDTSINYYASRYFFIVLIPSIIILFSLIEISSKWKKVILIISILINIPFNLVQYNSQEFKGNLQMIEDAVSVIKPQSIVLIDSNAYPELYTTNLRERNNNLVFPLDVKLKESEIKDKDVYIISNKEYYSNDLSQVLAKNYEISGPISNSNGIYPLKLEQGNMVINIYKVNKEPIVYMQNNNLYNGFYDVEQNQNGEYYRWTDGDSKVNMVFYGARGKIRIYYGLIPFDKIKRKTINLNLSIDDNLIYRYELNKDNILNGYVEFNFTEENIKDVLNHILEIKCDTWSPSEYGSEDTRQLGIPIKKIEVIK